MSRVPVLDGADLIPARFLPPYPSTPGAVGADPAGAAEAAAADAEAAAIAAAADALALHIVATDPHGDRAYTDTQIDALINGAPGLLDTLGELAAAWASDQTALGTLTTAVNARLEKAANLADLIDIVAARTNLGLGSAATHAHGDYQPADGDLADIAALAPPDNNLMQRKAGVWTARTPAQVKADLALDYPYAVMVPALIRPETFGGPTPTIEYQPAALLNADIFCGTVQFNWMEWDVVLAAGTYLYRQYWRRSPNSGIVTVSIDGADIGNYDASGTAGNNFITEFTGVAISTSGHHKIRTRADSKNATATAYAQAIHAFSLTRTGA